MTYDHWKTTDPNDGGEPTEAPVFTETEVAALVEEMRARCEDIARERSYGEFEIADAIAAIRRP